MLCTGSIEVKIDHSVSVCICESETVNQTRLLVVCDAVVPACNTDSSGLQIPHKSTRKIILRDRSSCGNAPTCTYVLRNVCMCRHGMHCAVCLHCQLYCQHTGISNHCHQDHCQALECNCSCNLPFEATDTVVKYTTPILQPGDSE